MAKRPTQKPENTEGENGAGKPADTPHLSPAGADQTGGAPGGESDPALSALHTEGGEAEKSTGAPMAAPGPTQEQSGGGVDGDAGAPAGNPTENVTGNPPKAITLGTYVSGAGGPKEADRAALEAAVAAITGEQMSIIPSGMDIVITPRSYVLKITGPKNGRRRAGRDFGREPVLIPIEDLTDAEVKALNDDPALIVEVLPNGQEFLPI